VCRVAIAVALAPHDSSGSFAAVLPGKRSAFSHMTTGEAPPIYLTGRSSLSYLFYLLTGKGQNTHSFSSLFGISSFGNICAYCKTKTVLTQCQPAVLTRASSASCTTPFEAIKWLPEPNTHGFPWKSVIMPPASSTKRIPAP